MKLNIILSYFSFENEGTPLSISNAIVSNESDAYNAILNFLKENSDTISKFTKKDFVANLLTLTELDSELASCIKYTLNSSNLDLIYFISEDPIGNISETNQYRIVVLDYENIESNSLPTAKVYSYPKEEYKLTSFLKELQDDFHLYSHSVETVFLEENDPLSYWINDYTLNQADTTKKFNTMVSVELGRLLINLGKKFYFLHE